MALNQFFTQIIKFLRSFKITGSNYKTVNFKYLIYLFPVLAILIVFISASNLVEQKNQIESKNFDSAVKTKDFTNLSDYFISKINSPYKEIKYLISL